VPFPSFAARLQLFLLLLSFADRSLPYRAICLTGFQVSCAFAPEKIKFEFCDLVCHHSDQPCSQYRLATNSVSRMNLSIFAMERPAAHNILPWRQFEASARLSLAFSHAFEFLACRVVCRTPPPTAPIPNRMNLVFSSPPAFHAPPPSPKNIVLTNTPHRPRHRHIPLRSTLLPTKTKISLILVPSCPCLQSRVSPAAGPSSQSPIVSCGIGGKTWDAPEVSPLQHALIRPEIVHRRAPYFGDGHAVMGERVGKCRHRHRIPRACPPSCSNHKGITPCGRASKAEPNSWPRHLTVRSTTFFASAYNKNIHDCST